MSDIFTLDENNNAAVRTVSVKAGGAETNRPDIFTTDENGNAAVRVVGSGGDIDESRVIIKSADIPVASADELNKFYCYDGETNATYTHGYIYQCVAGSPYYEANIAFEQSTFASEDFYKAGQLIVDAGVANPESVASVSMTYALDGNLWSIVFKDSEDNALNTAYSIYTEDLEQDYDILPVIDPSEFTDGQVVTGSVNNIVEHVDYSWERMDVQPAAKIGRYLSGWNCATGLAMTNPPESPYTYTTGDYFIVGVVATGGASNYKPNGSSYTTGVASTTVETSVVNVNDMYLYDGTNWTLLKTGSTVTSINGQVGDINIKSVNGNSLIGSGDLELSTYLTYPAGWTTNSTTKALCDDIAADATAIVGKAYLGEVTCSDLPASMVNGEIVVEIMSGTTSANKVIVLSLKSGNVAPYAWQYVYWNGGSNVSGWQTLGASLPSQSGNSGKFLKTNGTDVSWANAIENTATGGGSFTIGGTATTQMYCINIGGSSTCTGGMHGIALGQNAAVKAGYAVALGGNASCNKSYSVSVGDWASTTEVKAIALGAGAKAQAYGALQIGGGTNTTAGTLFVNLEPSSGNGHNYQLLAADGTIPKERLANAATVPSTMPTLTVAGWSSNTQSVIVNGVTTTNTVIISPAPASAADYAAAGIICTAQGTDSLTFTCTQTPSNDITVNVVIM